MSNVSHTELNRRAVFGVIALLAFWPASALSKARLSEPHAPTIMFVCQYGSVKSAITRELFKRQARKAGIAVKVISRGITPEAHLNPKVQEQLAREGIDPASEPLTRLRRADLRKADIVISFNTIPASFGEVRALDWSATPSVNDDYANARVAIDRHIDALLESIAAGTTAAERSP